MILYLDTSSIVKIYIEEDGSADVRAAIEAAGAIASSRVAYVEAHAALGAAARRGRIDAPDFSLAIEGFRSDWSSYVKVEVTENLARLAAELSIAHGLRGFDAVHLASAVTLRNDSNDDVRFMASDRALIEASAALGF